ncbi:SIR2 family protein [Vibrio parahaemolyticus]|uniref:SIR2 family protein n=1 Tax=Vibrio TaxID=662 RepID=UPI0012905534|nr:MULTISPECIES: SIR2 family protein [Vibrio]EGQ9502550.1 SIR2 family protein [Vibrio cholerae]ELG4787516.1 SIR2 family protein [Vibrio vulnificus]EJL6445457.1 SIR2 family protein [Vibrio cholerae]EKD9024450.1 SIR2 family protein [Vibrio parahaemolyticus]NAW70393.1 SIR2 family protein [Vibrio sp. V28_P6S34P95]
MTETVHNPDQYMYDFRHLITHSRKKIGILVGAGAPVSINVGDAGNWKSLIPDIKGLTNIVEQRLEGDAKLAFLSLAEDLGSKNIELILSRVRVLSGVIGDTKIHGLNGTGFEELSVSICEIIKDVVSKELPEGDNPYGHLISWVNGINRDYAVELFTTNYDLLLEEAMERSRTPYFDGFSGSKSAFFDPSSISSNDLPPRWIRLWKLHGSINWSRNAKGEVIRLQGEDDGSMVYPSHVKYDQTQAAPFSSMFERLKRFLLEPDSLLITTGFSFADAHITAKIDECLAENQSSAVIALQFKDLSEESDAVEVGLRRPNLSIYCRDGAIINGVKARWKLGEMPSKNWGVIRDEYWINDKFILGDYVALTRFLAGSGGGKSISVEVQEQDEPDEQS